MDVYAYIKNMNSATQTYTSTCPALAGLTYDTEGAAVAATVNSGGANREERVRQDDGSLQIVDENGWLLGVVRAE